MQIIIIIYYKNKILNNYNQLNIVLKTSKTLRNYKYIKLIIKM